MPTSDEEHVERTVFVVTGATLRAETMDRPLAYRIKQIVDERLADLEGWQCVVISDIWYLNNDSFTGLPTISVGGPGVNALSSYLFERLPTMLAIDNVLMIQMDPTMKDVRCAVWGMDHETTVEAVETFIEKGHLDRFLGGLGDS
ncbi:MAG: hypothetical protein JXQ73_18375 [Phycisphaerae bacterium]|nr:hypothetical protein [Phycisphaerae bacterium]